MPPRVHGCSEEELKYPVFTRSMAAKRRRKIFGQPSKTLLFPKGAYIWEVLYQRGLITRGI